MKIDRLIGILSVLLKQDRVTAPELAEKFEVSRRTINRDIEDLCRAGIPVFPKQKDIKKQPMFTCLQTKEYCY